MPNFATQVHPLTALLKKGRKWSWVEKQEDSPCVGLYGLFCKIRLADLNMVSVQC